MFRAGKKGYIYVNINKQKYDNITNCNIATAAWVRIISMIIYLEY